MRGCLDVTTLIALANGELSAAETAEVEAHLMVCRRCAEALARVPIDDHLVERLRELEHSREDLASALIRLQAVQERVTTTLFTAK